MPVIEAKARRASLADRRAELRIIFCSLGCLLAPVEKR
jgi:hypothetical protein